MCLILDANKFSNFLDPNDTDMLPVRNWIENSNGKIVYSKTEQLESELNRHGKMNRWIRTYRRLNKLKYVHAELVKQKEKNLPELESNDSHIIALAIVAKTKILVSGDKKLHTDFKKIVKGKIYQTRNHEHLLHDNLCP